MLGFWKILTPTGVTVFDYPIWGGWVILWSKSKTVGLHSGAYVPTVTVIPDADMSSPQQGPLSAFLLTQNPNIFILHFSRWIIAKWSERNEDGLMTRLSEVIPVNWVVDKSNFMFPHQGDLVDLINRCVAYKDDWSLVEATSFGIQSSDVDLLRQMLDLSTDEEGSGKGRMSKGKLQTKFSCQVTDFFLFKFQNGYNSQSYHSLSKFLQQGHPGSRHNLLTY